MKTIMFTGGYFYHPSKSFRMCVNTMTKNVFTHHFAFKKSMSDSIKIEADKMPVGLKQYYADLFLLTTLVKVKYEYDKLNKPNYLTKGD